MLDYHPFSEAVYDDPYPFYRRLRDEAPAFYLEEFDCWFLSRFEDIWTRLQDQRPLTSRAGTTTTHLLTKQTPTAPNLSSYDGPEHARIRGYFSPFFLPAAMRKSEAFHVEVDVLPGGFVCSASFKGRSSGEEVLLAVGGEMPLRKLFSAEQRAFFAEHAPRGIELDSLVTLGPTFALKSTFGAEISPGRKKEQRKMVAEMWTYPDYSRILELSTKCAPGDALDVAGQVREYLAERGVDLSGEQQTKTKTALEFFATNLPREEPAKAEAGGPTEPAPAPSS